MANELLKRRIAEPVEFVYYKDGGLWYRSLHDNFLFPVPITDIGNATFLARDKGILFMRYIRGHMNDLSLARVEQES